MAQIREVSSDRLQIEYKRKFASAKIITNFNSCFLFEKDKELQNVIHALKYNKRFPVGIFLGKLLAEKLKSENQNWQIDCIVPVQTTLNQQQRQENIAQAFKAKHKNIIKGKTFLLVDDVITTGATISECGKVLLNAGAKKIYACSVAIPE